MKNLLLRIYNFIIFYRREKKIVIIIPSYNNSKWYKRNLDSVLSQHYSNYSVIYIDDNSSDNTAELVESYTNMHKNITLIKNKNRNGALKNIYEAIKLCDDNDIIVTLDGDDWFAHEKVLSTINYYYSKYDIWITYGQFIRWPFGEIGQCKELNSNVDFRKLDNWYPSHLRTFYAWLFKGIKDQDLKAENEFFIVSWDLAFMIPMLEMAKAHFKFINQILYVYNMNTPINDFRINQQKQIKAAQIIKNKEKYSAI
ncbi:hypothetical protein A3F66_05310 [candidate division TM6 bacterium RIFCSPHIGHO2_12_FULL_32_22]|nr:MAG: hypothetical protein A3F66_05310 [candidate division TM6 bacterium RIFCSPHIGHO2_12_FULL_32_22]